MVETQKDLIRSWQFSSTAPDHKKRPLNSVLSFSLTDKNTGQIRGLCCTRDSEEESVFRRSPSPPISAVPSLRPKSPHTAR